jgi:ABC-2 type transport system permease protein
MFGRYVRMWLVLARFSLLREFAFRANFLVRIFVEVLWLGLQLLFYRTLFTQTGHIANWTEPEYFFFVGVHNTVSGLLEAIFLDSCNNFAELVRTGDLDFVLLKPMDEQFLVSCRSIDFACLPTVLMGIAIMLVSMQHFEHSPGIGRIALFVLLVACGCCLAYGFLLLLTSLSVWFMRNQSLMEMWWLFGTLMRYPREIFNGPFASPVGWVFSFLVPIILVTNVPANVMAKNVLNWQLAAYMIVATVVVLAVSRWFFRNALQRYRSASS